MLDTILKKVFGSKWYCAKCDQFVGEGKKPNQCQRCGSNRMTKNDPLKGRGKR